MSDRMRWIDTLGGPHILLPEELLSSWRGIEGWRDHRDPLDQSDYARACRAGNTWLGMIHCGDSQALILGGEVGRVAWLPLAERAGGVLVQWIYAADEKELLDSALGPLAMDVLNSPAAEKVDFLTGPSGAMRLFDAAEIGDEITGDERTLALKPGRHHIRAAYVKSARFAMVVREITACH